MNLDIKITYIVDFFKKTHISNFLSCDYKGTIFCFNMKIKYMLLIFYLYLIHNLFYCIFACTVYFLWQIL